MPEPSEYTNESDWMAECVPMRVAEGDEQEQAVAVCMAMWADKTKAIDPEVLHLDNETVADATAVKVGARNSRDDSGRLQMIHDLAVENGAKCADFYEEQKSADSDVMIMRGGEMKFLGMTDDGAHVGGYLVTFSDVNDPDYTGDFFSAETDFGIEDGQSLPVYFHHAQPLKLRDGGEIVITRRIGRGTVQADGFGLLMDAIIYNRDEYEKAIAENVKSLGWSSGALGHMVERDYIRDGIAHVKRWVIGEASLTPTPAEPKNKAISLKTLVSPRDEDNTLAAVAEVCTATSAGGEPNIKNQTETPMEDPKMDENTIKGMVETAISSALPSVVENAIKAYAESTQPEVKAGYADVKVTGDEADRALAGNPYKNAGEFLQAVRGATLFPGALDKRLLPLKATGLNEAIPSQGGFLIPTQYAAGIYERMYNVGEVLKRVNNTPVAGNNLTINAIDETSRVAGSRMGGVLGYWLEEGGTKQTSKPKFRQIDLKLKKVAALCYATDELLDDATALSSWMTTNVPEELRFMVEDSVYNGDGVGKPLGFMQSPALVSVTRIDANEVDIDDVSKMMARRWPGPRDYVWLINPEVLPQLIQMTVGTTPVFIPQGGASASPYATLMGLPLVETEYSAALGTTGDIALVALSQYQMISKGDVKTDQSIHVAFTTDETAFRFVYRCDGEPLWNSTLTPFKSSNALSPFVVLSTSS